MTTAPDAPPILPTVSELNRPFWDGCRAGLLQVQKCTDCGSLRYPASPVCPECLGSGAEWHALSGRGTVFSFIVFQRAYNPAWAAKVPYNVSMVELDEGIIMFSNVVGIPNEQMAVGLAVEVRFERVTDEIHIPVFVPRVGG